MLWRLGKVFIVTLSLSVTGMLGAPEPAACVGFECLEATDWVCCYPSPENCDSWTFHRCNTAKNDNPFIVECGY